MTNNYTLHVFRALPFGADARVERFPELFGGSRTVFVTWGDALRMMPSIVNVPLARPKGKHILMAFLYPLVSLWMGWYVLFCVKRGDVCVFIDFECAVFGLLIGRLKGLDCVFDIADPFYLVKPVPFPRFFCWLEERLSRYATITTLPHALRAELYPKALSDCRVVVVENVPLIPEICASMGPEDRIACGGSACGCHAEEVSTPKMRGGIDNGRRLVLGYFGHLETNHRGLEDLIALAQKLDSLELVVAGTGALAPYFMAAQACCNRIRFLGAFTQTDLMRMAADLDVYVGLYYASKPLHRHATPNKFYEHLSLGLPLLTSVSIPFASRVVDAGTGWVIPDGREALFDWALGLRQCDLAGMRLKAKELWELEYSRYYEMKRSELASALSGT